LSDVQSVSPLGPKVSPKRGRASLGLDKLSRQHSLPGPTVPPGCPHSLPHTPPRMPRYFVGALFSLQTLVDRSERVEGCWCWSTSKSDFPRGLALHPEVHFAWSWVGYPSRRPKGCGVQSPLGPKVYPIKQRTTQSWRMPSITSITSEEEEQFITSGNRRGKHNSLSRGAALGVEGRPYVASGIETGAR